MAAQRYAVCYKSPDFVCAVVSFRDKVMAFKVAEAIGSQGWAFVIDTRRSLGDDVIATFHS